MPWKVISARLFITDDNIQILNCDNKKGRWRSLMTIVITMTKMENLNLPGLLWLGDGDDNYDDDDDDNDDDEYGKPEPARLALTWRWRRQGWRTTVSTLPAEERFNNV